MELIAHCPLQVASVVWRPTHGGWAFTVVCKATFDLRPDVSPLAAVQEPVWEADTFAEGTPARPGFATDLVPFKRRPEVLVVGHAHAADGAPVRSLIARIAVAEIDKAVEVVGDRYFGSDGMLGEPARFAKMPLVWERAAGGPGTWNPAGVALGNAADVDFFGRVRTPNLLAPGTVLRTRGDAVAPVSLGPMQPGSPVRAGRLNQHAERWDAARWNEQPLPENVDVGYFNAATDDQQRAAPFADEQLHLEHLHPRFAMLSTRLALVSPSVIVDDGAGLPEPLPVRCDTLVIDSDRGLAMLVWRARVLLARPDRAGHVIVSEASLSRTMPAWALRASQQTAVGAAAAPTVVAEEVAQEAGKEGEEEDEPATQRSPWRNGAA